MKTSRLLLLALGLLLPAIASLAATAPGGVLDRLRAGQAVDLIVEFNADAVNQEAIKLRRARGKQFDDDAVLAVRAQGYAAIRQQVDAALAGEHIDRVLDYSHLPMATRRFRSAAALEALLARPEVKAVFDDSVRYYPVLAQSLPLINQPEVAAVGYQGAGTMVAVIDNGIDYGNSAFGCSAPANPASCPVLVSSLVGGATGTTDSSHGTNVSAIVLGVAPATKIAMLNAFSGDSASATTILAGLNWAIQHKNFTDPNNSSVVYKIAAINMSLGDGSNNASVCSSPYTTAIASANTAGISVVVASGNNQYLNGISSPACTQGAISVGAVYDANLGDINFGLCEDATTAADQVACFSNSSDQLTLLAPGALITAAGITDAGTSQATPHVAGAVAVLRGAFPSESLATTRTRLTATGAPVTDQRKGTDGQPIARVTPRMDLEAAAAPANNAFATRTTISGTSGSATGNSLLATEEGGEPSHGGSGGAHSVWWQWTAPSSGQVSLDTSGSGFDTLLGVHTGSAVNALSTIAGNDNVSVSVTTSSLLFQAVAGTAYKIAVDGANGAAGAISLHWSLNTSAKANLAVGISGPASGSSGANATYTVTASNAGPQSATNVAVTITLPANATLVSGSVGCTVNGSQVICGAGTLANGGQAVFSIVVAWDAASAGATLATSVASDVTDPGSTDNSASLVVAVAEGSGDVPTLPAWAALLSSALLLGAAVRAPRDR